jgi:ABC-type transporter Mla subunit MlaD
MNQTVELWHALTAVAVTVGLWIASRFWDRGSQQHSDIQTEVAARQRAEIETQRRLAEKENELRTEFRNLINEETKELRNDSSKIETLIRALDRDVREHVVAQQGRFVEMKAEIQGQIAEHRAETREALSSIRTEFTERLHVQFKETVTKDDFSDLKDDFNELKRQQTAVIDALQQLTTTLASRINNEDSHGGQV